ncbi:uncharacterized protein ACN427_012497 isoform 2-T2 [Glossina fuscipes fuscipes]
MRLHKCVGGYRCGCVQVCVCVLFEKPDWKSKRLILCERKRYSHKVKVMVNSRNINNYNDDSGNDNNMVVDITRPVSMYDNLNMTGTVHTPKTKIITATTATTTTTSAETFNCASFDNANVASDMTTPFNIPSHELNGNINNKQFLTDDNKSNLFQTPNITTFHTFPYKSNAVITEIPAAAAGTLPSLPCLTTITKAITTMTTTTTTITPATITTNVTAPQPVELVSITSLASSLLEGPAITTTITTTTSALTPQTTKSNTSLATISTTATQHRPLSQHSQSELNETGHNIAAVKAALNEAKSKFFGLNGYTSQQDHQQYQQHQQQQQQQEESCEFTESQNLLDNRIEEQQQQQQQQQQHAQHAQQVQNKIQPKYQNIPENSALFRRTDMRGESNDNHQENHNNYQHTVNNKQIATTTTTTTAVTANPNKMPVITSYKQIPLNDVAVDNAQPSQAVYMATTVPQNIKGTKIAGRHTPTRSSLRHSRMLVISNKNYQESQYPNPLGFRQPQLARWLIILQIICGSLIISLSIWEFFLAPNTAIKDNPYWSGLILILSGIVSLTLLRYLRNKRNKTRENCFIFLRTNAYVLAVLSALLCCMALILASAHYNRLTAADTKCESINVLLEHGSCICTFHAQSASSTNASERHQNDTISETIHYFNENNNSYKIEYRDLSCQEVTDEWITILILSIIFNCFALLVTFTYLILVCCCRNTKKVQYSSVQTSTF